MADLDKHAAGIVASLVAFRDRVRAEKPAASESLSAIDHVLQSLDGDFNLDLVDARGRKRSLEADAADQEKLKRALRDAHREVQELKDRLDDDSGSKMGGHLRKIWFLRAGLGNPSVPAQTLSQLFRDFSLEEGNKISATYIGTVRDAWAEILKLLNRSAGEQLAQDSGGSLFITHCHDEALLRVRSFAAALGKGFCRSRYSKVLEHTISLHAHRQSMKWFCEMQALMKKDAPTIDYSHMH